MFGLPIVITMSMSKNSLKLCEILQLGGSDMLHDVPDLDYARKI